MKFQFGAAASVSYTRGNDLSGPVEGAGPYNNQD